MLRHALTQSVRAVTIVAALTSGAATVAIAQQITGTPGSPEATTRDASFPSSVTTLDRLSIVSWPLTASTRQ